MKIYTKTGDDGTTGLIGGQRVSKDHGRIDAYGTVDELNAALGLAVVVARTGGATTAELTGLLTTVQNELFAVGSWLATPPGSPYAASLPPVRREWAERLESEIDSSTQQMEKLTQFILPGGTELAARLHLARTVARRAERGVVTLMRVEPLEEERMLLILTYLNRLSDWLFVHSRLANHLTGVGDVVWVKN